MKYFNNESNLSGWELTRAAWVFLNAVFDHATPVLNAYGLYQKLLVLLALLDIADTPQELAHLLRTPPSTVSHMLKEIEEKGLIVRTIDPTDKRKFRLKRTHEGDIALQAGIEAVNVAVEARLSAFDPEQQETLRKALPLLLTLNSETNLNRG